MAHGERPKPLARHTLNLGVVLGRNALQPHGDQAAMHRVGACLHIEAATAQGRSQSDRPARRFVRA